MKYLTQHFFSGNRQKLAEASGAELIVIRANSLLQKSADVPHEFEQDSNFFYLSGLNELELILVIDVASKAEYLIRSKSSRYIDLFDGTMSPSDIAMTSGITEIYDFEEGWLKLKQRLAQVKQVHTLEPPKKYFNDYKMFTNPSRAQLVKSLKADFDGDIKYLNHDLMKLRSIKQPEEINAMRRAIDLTCDALRLVESNLDQYKYEYEVEADIMHHYGKNGYRKVSYRTIVASGANAANMHHYADETKIDKTKPLMIDTGAVVEGYTADLTRTFMPAERSEKAHKLYEEVMFLYDKAMKAIKPGVRFIDYEREIRDLYVPVMEKLGLIKHGDGVQETIDYAPTATSHFLGLDVHDVGDYKWEFVPGMVITVEPGIYVPEWSCGIRVEDNVLITEDGIEVLSASLPTNLKEIE